MIHSHVRARQFASRWLKAWNTHDLAAIMALYADPPCHTSPLVAERLGVPDGTLSTREALQAYFAHALTPGSTLRFEPIDTFVGLDVIGILYRNHRAQTVLEVLSLDEAGLIGHSIVSHRLP
jgi:hypothetical protein